MAKRAELDPNSVKNLFSRTETKKEPADEQTDGTPAEEKETTKNTPAEKKAAKPKTSSRKTTRGAKDNPPTGKTYDLIRLMAVGGKWVYLTQITDPAPILTLLDEFENTFTGKYIMQKVESPLGMVGYIALSGFEHPLTAGDAFRWFAAELAHSGWEPFFAEQSPPNIPVQQYRDALTFRLEQDS